jgi:CheY-like chemotaxis protein
MKKILIIDDENEIAVSTKYFLEVDGLYQVRIENDSRCAVEAAGTFLPDLILLDLVMPFLDGTEVAERLARDPRCRNIPIVFLTSLVTPAEAAERGGKIGGRSFIAKPIKAPELLRRIEEELRPSGG